MQARIIALLLVLWLPLTAAAESSVWRVSQGATVFYLAGSIHVLRATDYPLPPEFDAAFRESQQLVVEMDPAAAQGLEAQQMILARGVYPGNESIRDHLSPALYRRLDDYCKGHHTSLALLGRFKPWLLTMTLTMDEMSAQGFDARAGIDMHYSQLAAQQGKAVLGLESMEEQVNALAAFDGAADPVVSNFLDEAATSAQTMREMVAAWRQGDAERLDGLVSRELRSKYPALYQSVLVDRTRRWVAPLERITGTGKRTMVIVGSAHLVGEDGLLALLRGRGYQVEPLRFSAR